MGNELDELKAEVQSIVDVLNTIEVKSFQAFLDCQRQLIQASVTQAMILSALDQLIKPGIKDQIIDQASEEAERQWQKWLDTNKRTRFSDN